MSTTATSSTTPTGSSTLDQADYLKLLVTQMTEQDPLNPQSDTAFAAQLAQFSSLQETQTMTNNLQSMQATSLIGQTVSVASNANSSQTTSGVVSSVSISAGVPSLVIGGQLYALSQLTGVVNPSAASTASGNGSGSAASAPAANTTTPTYSSNSSN
jgi:flagellar basal-body rod modification protein FlgD